MNIDYSLYLVTDHRFVDEAMFLTTIEQTIKGGVTVVQLREKQSSTKDFYDCAVTVKKLTQRYNIPLIINDRLDIALAVDAEGLHIGQADLPYEVARKIFGSNKIIGLSVSNYEQVELAIKTKVDYLGISPVLGTNTKTDISEPFGIKGVEKIRSMTKLPLVAIGGIKSENAAQILEAGADGLAVVSALMGAENPCTAAMEFANIIKAVKV